MSEVKDKERILKAAREKKVTYKGKPIILSADFSLETLQTRREWHGIAKVLREKNLQSRIFYLGAPGWLSRLGVRLWPRS